MGDKLSDSGHTVRFVTPGVPVSVPESFVRRPARWQGEALPAPAWIGPPAQPAPSRYTPEQPAGLRMTRGAGWPKALALTRASATPCRRRQAGRIAAKASLPVRKKLAITPVPCFNRLGDN